MDRNKPPPYRLVELIEADYYALFRSSLPRAALISRFEDLWDEANRGAMALIGVADGRNYVALLKRMHEGFETHLSISGSSMRRN